jgi:MoxR-like ATPase
MLRFGLKLLCYRETCFKVQETDMEVLPTDLISRIVDEESQARVNALRAAADDPRRTLEEADYMRALAGLFEAERDSVNTLREIKNAS